MRSSGLLLGFWLAAAALLCGRASASDADVAKAMADDNGDTSEAWGVQSGCTGCSFHQAHVKERRTYEVLAVDCHCPPNPLEGCVCAAQFDWWWNLQCAGNATVVISGCGDGGKEQSGVDWTLIVGNMSGSNYVRASASSCNATAANTPAQCEAALNPLIRGSTRRVQVEFRLRGKCSAAQRISWRLPIAADLECTSVAEVLDQVEHGGAGELVIAVVMIIVGFCVGSLVMRARNRTPSFNEKPSAYMTRMENEAEEGYEMDGLGDVDPQNETSPSLRR